MAKLNSGTRVYGNLTVDTFAKTSSTTVTSLTAAATAGAGARSFVTDANTAVFGTAVSGSGAIAVPVYSDGSAWRVG